MVSVFGSCVDEYWKVKLLRSIGLACIFNAEKTDSDYKVLPENLCNFVLIIRNYQIDGF